MNEIGLQRPLDVRKQLSKQKQIYCPASAS